jgi:hypothetical protein
MWQAEYRRWTMSWYPWLKDHERAIVVREAKRYPVGTVVSFFAEQGGGHRDLGVWFNGVGGVVEEQPAVEPNVQRVFAREEWLTLLFQELG